MANQPIQQFFGLQQTVFGSTYSPPPNPQTDLLWSLDVGRNDLVYSDTYSTQASDGNPVKSIKSTTGDWGFLQPSGLVYSPTLTVSGPTGSYLQFDGVQNGSFMEMTTSPTGNTGPNDAWDSAMEADDYTIYLVAENDATQSGVDSVFCFLANDWTSYGVKMYNWQPATPDEIEAAFGSWSIYSSGLLPQTGSGNDWPFAQKYIFIMRGSTTSNCTYQLAVNGSKLTEITGIPNPSYSWGPSAPGRSLLGAAWSVSSGNTPWSTSGMSRWWKGKVFEYGCFKGYATDAEVNNLFAYFNNKHNIF